MAESPILKSLREWGCDITGAMERFADNEEFYLSYLPMVAREQAFEQLHTALQTNDTTRAFECAHLLKGLIGNMGLTPMYDECCAVVETLRRGKITRETRASVERLLNMLAKFTSMLSSAGLLDT